MSRSSPEKPPKARPEPPTTTPAEPFKIPLGANVAESDEPAKNYRYAKLPNAMVDNGYLRDLSAHEIKVVLACIRFANSQTGITFVGPEKLAEVTGIDPRHVQRTVASLKNRGVLVTVDGGGGRNRPAKRLIRFPKTPAVSATVLADQNPGSFEHETPAVFATKPRQFLPPEQDLYSRLLSRLKQQHGGRGYCCC